MYKRQLMHNVAFRAAAVRGVYLKWVTMVDELEDFLNVVDVLGIKGFNVTIPHKESIVPLLDRVDPVAERIGAVSNEGDAPLVVETVTTSCGCTTAVLEPMTIAPGESGILRITLLKDVLIASGAGVGGGSLVYANTLYEPLDEFYNDPQWADITDWKSELAPHFAQAKKMLGVTTYKGLTPADEVMQSIARDYGVGDTFHPADVGVLFGAEPGAEIDDPFFGGAGPERKACIYCGACMTGCRHNAKNTLVKNLSLLHIS